MIKWIRTSGLSMKNSLSQVGGGMAPYCAREVGMAPYYGGYGTLLLQVGRAPNYAREVGAEVPHQPLAEAPASALRA